MSYSVRDFVKESNRIEGVLELPSDAEIAEHQRFVALERVTVEELQTFVSVYEPRAVLRDRHGLNVQVGRHRPPKGAPEIRQRLEALLLVAADAMDPWATHVAYETLHPFTDGNGRSGRALWAWQMDREDGYPLGFLHHFYYQTLANVGRAGA